MKRVKRILLVLCTGIILTGCGESTYKQGVENLQDEKYEEAIGNFEKAVEKEKNVADSYRGIGIANMELENYEEASEAFEKALENGAKETGTIYDLLGVCRMKAGDYEGAIDSFERGIEEKDCTDEMIQEMRFNAIVSYEKLKDWDSAKEKLAAYVEDYPDDEDAKKEAEFLETR